MSEKKTPLNGEYVSGVKTTVESLMEWVCIRVNCKHHQHNDSFDNYHNPQNLLNSPDNCRKDNDNSVRNHRLKHKNTKSEMNSQGQHCVLPLDNHSNYFSLDLSGTDAMPSTESMYQIKTATLKRDVFIIHLDSRSTF